MLNRNWQEPSRYALTDVRRTDVPTRALSALLHLLIRAYQYFVSPLLGPTCRFHPSCSNYAIEAIDRYGPLRGSARALARLTRCHPFSEGGFDPVR